MAPSRNGAAQTQAYYPQSNQLFFIIWKAAKQELPLGTYKTSIANHKKEQNAIAEQELQRWVGLRRYSFDGDTDDEEFVEPRKSLARWQQEEGKEERIAKIKGIIDENRSSPATVFRLFPFLPLELRRTIWKMCLSDPKVLHANYDATILDSRRHPGTAKYHESRILKSGKMQNSMEEDLDGSAFPATQCSGTRTHTIRTNDTQICWRWNVCRDMAALKCACMVLGGAEVSISGRAPLEFDDLLGDEEVLGVLKLVMEVGGVFHELENEAALEVVRVEEADVGSALGCVFDIFERESGFEEQ
ncbi:uncharacterized protein PAC_19094 [Phialocephala subalpina]|uniref:2EXR domain-containing protein n=1 Tax=Phialocephala subalpina TaxID=576137 RepID=A0A1L7XVX7_9HELO|nr:uncharacterized protein PAC_19094 [Phialocephala subalpina]